MVKIIQSLVLLGFCPFLYGSPTPKPAQRAVRGGGQTAVGHTKTQGDFNLAHSVAATPAVTTTPAVEKNSGHATEQIKRVDKGSPILYREAAGTPTPGPVGAVKFGRDKLKGITREAAGTPTPDPVEIDPHGTTINNSKSNSFKVGGSAANVTPTPATSHANSGHATETMTVRTGITLTPDNSRRTAIHDAERGGQPTPEPARAVKFGRDKLKGTTREAAGTQTPAPGPVGSINLNSSRSNIYRVRPTVTPTPAVKHTRPGNHQPGAR